MRRKTTFVLLMSLAVIIITMECGGDSAPSDQLIEQLVSDQFEQNVLRSVLKNTAISQMQIPRNGKVSSLEVLSKENVSDQQEGNTDLVAYSCEIRISGTYEVMDARGNWATETFEDKVLPVYVIKGLKDKDTWSLEWPMSALLKQ